MEKIISKTPLHQQHKNLQAKMVSFAGYDMPLSYPLGTIKEHLWCREHAALFDVSHMGQLILTGENVAEELSRLTPTNIAEKPLLKCVYSMFLNDQGGVEDDLIAVRLTERKMFVVVNAACVQKDMAYLRQNLPNTITVELLENRALMALQGPKAETVLQKLVEAPLSQMPFMTFHEMSVAGHACYVSRSGYTGEDGFEISIAAAKAPALWQQLLESEWVEAAGLAARDTLRLEAGLPLYGQDLTASTTPAMADMAWVCTKNFTGFKGCAVLNEQLEDQANLTEVLTGVILQQRGVLRQGMVLEDDKGDVVGRLTSGGYAPSLQKSIALAYVDPQWDVSGQKLFVKIRNQSSVVKVCGKRFLKNGNR